MTAITSGTIDYLSPPTLAINVYLDAPVTGATPEISLSDLDVGVFYPATSVVSMDGPGDTWHAEFDSVPDGSYRLTFSTDNDYLTAGANIASGLTGELLVAPPVDPGDGGGGSGGGGGGGTHTPTSDAAELAGADPSIARVEFGDLSIWGLDRAGEPFATSYDGTWQQPGFKGADVSLDGLTGALYIRKLHDVGAYKLVAEIDPGTVPEFFDQLDDLVRAFGVRDTPIRVTRPTGEVRLVDVAYLGGATAYTALEPNMSASVEAQFVLPYPYWRSEGQVSVTVGSGQHDLTEFAGITAPVEDLLLEAHGAGRLTDVTTGDYVEVSGPCDIDCGNWSGTVDLRTLRTAPGQARFFTLSPRAGRVPRVEATGSWTLTGYKRFLTP